MPCAWVYKGTDFPTAMHPVVPMTNGELLISDDDGSVSAFSAVSAPTWAERDLAWGGPKNRLSDTWAISPMNYTNTGEKTPIISLSNGDLVARIPFGVARSTDYGRSWVDYTGGVGMYYLALLGNGDLIRDGLNSLYKSSDGGLTWGSAIGSFGYPAGYVHNVAPLHGGGNIILQNDIGDLYSSSDYGDSWAMVASTSRVLRSDLAATPTTCFASSISTTSLYRIYNLGASVALMNISETGNTLRYPKGMIYVNGVLLLVARDSVTLQYHLYRSADDGVTWTTPTDVPELSSGARIFTDRSGTPVVFYTTALDGGASAIRALSTADDGVTWATYSLFPSSDVYGQYSTNNAYARATVFLPSGGGFLLAVYSDGSDPWSDAAGRSGYFLGYVGEAPPSPTEDWVLITGGAGGDKWRDFRNTIEYGSAC